MAARVAEKRPVPSLGIATDWKAPGEVEVASRHQSVAESEETADSSASWQEMVTTSVLFGTAGECFTEEMIGATLATRRVLAAPGVPPTAVEAPQFWPESTARSELRRSSEQPPLDCVIQDQPPRESRVRVAQSPSSA